MFKALRCPSVCQVCGAWPSATVCPTCVERYAQPALRCRSCALTSHDNPCCECIKAHQTPSWDACLAAVSYGFPWDTCIARFKFRGEPALGRCLAALMRHSPHVEPALEQADHVIAMPLSAGRLRERGFNQAYELAKHLVPHKAMGNALMRLGEGAHQVGASKQERLALVEHAFWVHPTRLAQLKHKRVVLVDDVMTTGATLMAAALALKSAGVAHITGLVFARAELR